MVRPDVTDTADWFGLVKNASPRVVPEEVVAGTEIPGGGGRGRLYLSLHCHHQNDSSIKMGSDGSQFNVSLTVRGQSHNTVFTLRPPTALEEKGEPKTGIDPRSVCLPARNLHLTTRPNHLPTT